MFKSFRLRAYIYFFLSLNSKILQHACDTLRRRMIVLRPGQAHLVAAIRQLRRGHSSIARRQSSASYAAIPIGSRTVLVVLCIRVLAID